ncbi:hypothetical protein F2P56_015484 [Juglans regia]|uniref:Uncharacterized protein LOC108979780 n=2 Tax=Juglans regia TaxID=51240 RepID=A0A2I4DG00_JUGRE|nr:uncharacterized protein LOC108979780 [Juglans regia]KAF5465477.1 hypothetical protein F2P56_015484 [Juglans regia]
MAAARCATFSSLTPSVNPTAATRTKPLVAASLRKPTRRKNYLRPKILKTLTKPSPNPVIPIISPETKTETHLDFESLTEQISGNTKAAADPGEGDRVEEFRVSETSAEYNGILGKLSAGSVLKYGAYFVGVFVLQTVCSVWIMGSGNSDRKERNLDNLDSSITESKKLLVNKNGIISGASNVVFAHDSELERKIEEIRAMAREARKSEAKVEEEDDEDEYEIDEETAISRHRAGIEKEMSATLNNLQKRLDSLPEKLPGSYVNYLGKSGKIENGANRDNLDSKGSNGALMFKKKLKFRSPSTKSIDGPKGFQGTGDRKVPNKKKRSSGRAGRIRGDGTVSDDGLELLDLEQQLERRHSDNPESTYRTVREDDEMISLTQDSTSKKDGKVLKEERQGSDLGIKIRVGNAERRTGAVQEPSLERPLVEVENLQQSAMLESQHSPRFRRGNRETHMKSDKHAVLNRNGSSKHREVGDQMLANKFKEKQPNIETDFWWLNLPYVLAIFMRRGSDREGQAGFYNLKFGSQAQEQSNSSYTVAFEDRVDASNFCFLLEDFFKDLGDFSADILPLSIKELHEAVKANAMKVVVVKKRQLQLYAGQPFADVEMALFSLVKGDQNAPTRNS